MGRHNPLRKRIVTITVLGQRVGVRWDRKGERSKPSRSRWDRPAREGSTPGMVRPVQKVYAAA